MTNNDHSTLCGMSHPKIQVELLEDLQQSGGEEVTRIYVPPTQGALAQQYASLRLTDEELAQIKCTTVYRPWRSAL